MREKGRGMTRRDAGWMQWSDERILEFFADYGAITPYRIALERD